jgi:hypothetical protein
MCSDFMLTVNAHSVATTKEILIQTTAFRAQNDFDTYLEDVNANGLVNSTDASLTAAQSGTSVGSANFRTDINANGLINSTDTSIVRSQSGTRLPSSSP